MLKRLSPLIQKITGKFGRSRTGWTIRTLPSGEFKIVRRRVGFGPAKDHPAVLYCQETWNLLDKVWSSLTRDQKAEWGICAKRSTTTARSGHDEFKSVNLNRMMLQMPGITSPPDAFKSFKHYEKTSPDHPDIPPGKEIPVWTHGNGKNGTPYTPHPPDGPIAVPPGAPYPFPPPELPPAPIVPFTPCQICADRAGWLTPVSCCRLYCSDNYPPLWKACAKEYNCVAFDLYPPSWAYRPTEGMQAINVFCSHLPGGTYIITVFSLTHQRFRGYNVKLDCNLCGGLKNKIWIDGTGVDGSPLPPDKNYWAYILFTDACPTPPPPPNECDTLAATMEGKRPRGNVDATYFGATPPRDLCDHKLFGYSDFPPIVCEKPALFILHEYNPDTVCWTFRGNTMPTDPRWFLTACCDRDEPHTFNVHIYWNPSEIYYPAPGPAFTCKTTALDVTDDGCLVGKCRVKGRTFWDFGWPFLWPWGRYYLDLDFTQTTL